LGDRFLGHIERCRALLHLVDGTVEDVGKAYETVRTELEAYGHGLAEKREIVVLNKADALSAEELKRQLAQLRRVAGRDRNRAKIGETVRAISAVSGEGVPAVLRAILAEIDGVRGTAEPKVAAPQWSP